MSTSESDEQTSPTRRPPDNRRSEMMRSDEQITEPDHASPEEGHVLARGVLRDYFTDWEDINAFVAEERKGWEEREKLLEEDRQMIRERFRTSRDESVLA